MKERNGGLSLWWLQWALTHDEVSKDVLPLGLLICKIRVPVGKPALKSKNIQESYPRIEEAKVFSKATEPFVVVPDHSFKPFPLPHHVFIHIFQSASVCRPTWWLLDTKPYMARATSSSCPGLPAAADCQVLEKYRNSSTQTDIKPTPVHARKDLNTEQHGELYTNLVAPIGIWENRCACTHTEHFWVNAREVD